VRVALLTTDSREHFKDYGSQKPYFGTAPEALLQGFGMLSGVEVHVLSCTQQPMPAPEKLASNVWFHPLHVPKWGWLRTGYQGCVRTVRQKLRDIQPDLVHAQGTERDCALSAVLSPYPKILTIHGNLRLIKKQVGFRPFSAMWLQSYLEGLVVPRFNGVICITNYTREAVEHEVSKTWVVPNAVDLSFLALGKKRLSDASHRPSTLDSRLKTPIILVVANIDPRKNQNAFIKALDPLARSMSFEIRFFGSCGEFDYTKQFKELIASRPWCYYGGMLGREELRSQFEQADMLVLPTHEDNCPMVVLEAQAAGVPAIATKVGGVPDLIENGVTGLLADPENPVTFYTAVEKLLINDGSLREQLARSAHQKALEQYHPRVIARKHLDIYRAALRESKTH
jgi:glycosyltransferase involved in cell wall biosynthesis